MSTLKIEAGRFYRARNGKKARIYATDGGGEYPVHGAIVREDGWEGTDWTMDGVYITHLEEPEDLIAEWREPQVDWSALPKWAMWVCRDGYSDQVWWFQRPPFPEDSTWTAKNDLYGRVPDEEVKHREGDWRESLEQRPTEGVQP